MYIVRIVIFITYEFNVKWEEKYIFNLHLNNTVNHLAFETSLYLGYAHMFDVLHFAVPSRLFSFPVTEFVFMILSGFSN